MLSASGHGNAAAGVELGAATTFGAGGLPEWDEFPTDCRDQVKVNRIAARYRKHLHPDVLVGQVT
jgi:hypothetical protein